VEVISGEEESRLAYLAVRAGLGATEGSLVVFDPGGGSSQFTFGQGPRVDERFGLAGAVGPEVLGDALAAIAADLSRLDGRPRPNELVGIGGAVTNMTAVKLELAPTIRIGSRARCWTGPSSTVGSSCIAPATPTAVA
jgi:exopolyphosphatase / guanosine-5'-triphosphate,3'-diphosphate pyrophosphatase